MRKNLLKTSLFFGLFILFIGTAKSQNGDLILTTPDINVWTCEVGELQTFIWKYDYTEDTYDKECDDINPSSIDLSIGTASGVDSAIEIVNGPSVTGCFVSINFRCLTDDPLILEICVNAADAFLANDGVGCFDLSAAIEEGDADGDGVADGEDCAPNDPNASGATDPCDDGDANTIDDQYDSSCNCSGQAKEEDTDDDGESGNPDEDDPDETDGPDGPDCTVNGSCDDGDANTVVDQYDSNCNCIGQAIDTDNDGVADSEDCAPNDPNASSRFDACDDGDANTTNDQYDSNCNCRGTAQDSDGDGVVDSEDCAPNDPNASSRFDACDDGNANTSNDQYDSNCNCRGQEQDSDGDGVVDSRDCAPDDPNVSGRGDLCDDGDASTENDQYDSNCNCRGEVVDRGDSDNDGVLNFEDCAPNDPNASSRFDPCDDGDDDTVDDQYDSNCNCRGRAMDSDNDGVPDSDDCAPTDPNASSRFDACDDGDPNTVNDQYDSLCRCRGEVEEIEVDSDNDGVPDDEDCAPNDPNASSRFDACDDGDVNTVNDQYDSNCNCSGEAAEAVDSDNDGVADEDDCAPDDPNASSRFDACDDGDVNTINDQFDSNCNCRGEVVDDGEVTFGPSESVVLFDLNDCFSTLGSGADDYSEFVAAYPNALDCATFTSSTLHRVNPNLNKHSCTPGAGGTAAMCVAASIDCDYAKTSSQALVFEVQVAATDVVSISGLKFLEKAPEQFDWINGTSGPNNYPTKYGVRILVDGDEVFFEDDISTTTDWTEESFTFDDILIEASATVKIEMLAYCPVGNGARASVWDVENIELLAACSSSSSSALVSGLVTSMNNKPLSDVLLTLEGYDFQQEYMTSASGVFDFGDVPMSSMYVLNATKKTDYLEGVSTLDLVQIQHHILGLDPFDDGFRYIAADINKDNKVSAIDLLQLRKLILGEYDELPNNDSYRFYDENESIDVVNPWTAQEELFLQSIEDFGTKHNLTGIKIGDVSIMQAEKRSNEVSVLNYRLRNDNVSGKQILDFYFEEEEQFKAVQLNLFLKNSNLDGLRLGQLDLASDNYNIIDGNELRISQNFEEAIAFDPSKPLFSLEIDFSGSIDDLTLVQDLVIKSELYNSGGDIRSIELVASDKLSGTANLVNIYPNPFSDVLSISLDLDREQNVTIEIFDLNGRKLYDFTNRLGAGKSTLNLNDIPKTTSSSLLISRVSVGDKIYTNKIMQTQE